MQINEMNLAEVEARLAEIDADIEKRSGEELEALKAETLELIQRKAELEDAEKRAALAKELEAGAEPQTIVERQKEDKIMSLAEIRESLEYGKAYLSMIKTGDDEECRSLLSDNAASGGNVPVPTFLENEIKTAWEDCKIMSLVKKSYLKGNVKVGFEVSATGASVHAEGAEAPDEEVVVLGTVELKAESIKKWITVSDEALEGTTVDTIGYLYKEIAHKIVEKAEEILVGKITASPAVATTTAAGVPQLTANAIAADTLVKAVALLSGQARNLHLVMNRQTYPAFVAIALAANYAIDVFDGLKDRIVFTDKLPAFSAASAGNVYAIVGDFGYGAQANFPNGDGITLKVDDMSLAEKDLVKIVGRQYVGMAVVADKAFVNIKK